MPQEASPGRMFAAGILASLVAGLVAGIGARIITYGLTLGIAEKLFNHYLPRKPPSITKEVPPSVCAE